MKNLPKSKNEQAVLLNAILTFLTKEKGWQKNEIARQIEMRPDALTKASSLTSKQGKFDGRTHSQLLEALSERFGITEVITSLEGRFEFKANEKASPPLRRTAGAGEEIAKSAAYNADFPNVFLSCSDSLWSNIGSTPASPITETSAEQTDARLFPRQMLYSGIIGFSSDWKRAEIRFYNTSPLRPEKIERGTVEHEAKTLIVGIEGTSAQRSRKRFTRGLFCFSTSGQLEGTEIFRGVFSTLSKDDFPVCGEVILVRVADWTTAFAQILQPAPPQVQFTLLQKLIRVASNVVPKTLSNLPKGGNLSGIAGNYKGHFFQSESKTFYEAVLAIYPNGAVSFANSQNFAVAHGFIFPQDRGGVYLIALDFKTRYPLSLLCLQIQGDVLEGCIGGLSFNAHPYAARIRLVRMEGVEIPPLPKGKIRASDSQAMQKFLENQGAEFLPFFLGKGASAKFLDDATRHLAPFEGFVETDVPELAGAYEFFCTEFHKDWGQDYIQKLEMLVDRTGRAKLKSGLKTQTYDGFFRRVGNYYFCGEMFDPSNREIPLFHLTLFAQGYETDGQFSFIGTYNGRSQGGQRPTAGRVILYKKENSKSWSEPLTSRNYPLDKRTEIAKLMEEKPFVLPFLLGQKGDDFIEGYEFFRRNRIYHNDTPEALLHRPAGCYWSLRLRFDGKTVNVNPLQILKNGQFSLKSTKPNAAGDNVPGEYSGVVNFSEKHQILSLRTCFFDDKPHEAHSLFKFSEIDHVACFLGTGVSVSESGQPLGSREVLVRAPDHLDFLSEPAKGFPLPFTEVDAKPESLMKGEISDAFRAYFSSPEAAQRLRQILFYLSGEDKNLLKTRQFPESEGFPDDADSPDSLGNICYAAACHFAREGDEEQTEKALLRAENAGFFIKHTNQFSNDWRSGRFRRVRSNKTVRHLAARHWGEA